MLKEVNVILNGNKEKSPLILLHGLNWTHRIWNSVMEHLKEDYFIIAVDLPGHGDSRRLEDYSFDNIAHVINQAITSLNLNKKVTLVGSSIGASIALTFASIYDMVETVILIDGGFFALKEIEGLTWNDIEKSDFPDEILKDKDAFIKFMKSDNPSLWNKHIEEAVLDQIIWCEKEQTYKFKVCEEDQIQYLKNEWEFDAIQLLNYVKAKIVLLVAFNDNSNADFLNEKIDNFQNKFENSLVYRFYDTDHLIMLDKEKEVIKIINNNTRVD